MTRRADPAVRAEDDLRRAARAHRWSHRLLSAALLAVAAGTPFLVRAAVERPGAIVGAVVASALCAGLAVAAWPWTWSPEEQEHRRLEAIWREARVDAEDAVPWSRFAAWAEADGERVRLLRLVCAPCTDAAPRRLRVELVREVEAVAIADAAEAMEQTRKACEDREHAARQAYDQAKVLQERLADDAALAAVDRIADDEQRAAEERMRREVEAEDAAERRAQAAALAEALRRP